MGLFVASLAVELALVAAIGVCGVGWYYSRVLEREAFRVSHDADLFDVEVIGSGDDWIELAPIAGGREWRRDGRYGLAWDGGYAPVGRIITRDDRLVVREWLDPGIARPPNGTAARLDAFAFPEDPAVAHGLAFSEVAVLGPLGAMPAWRVDGDPRTWAIFVHGKGATRREALRALPAFHDAGLTSLVVTYRNDAGNARDPGGRHAYGRTEWTDLEAAVRYALAQGAERIVLVGYSMGGAIVLNFMEQSSATASVGAIVLEAPMLDLGAAVDFEGGRRGIPGFVTAVGKRIAAWRFDVDWRALDYQAAAQRLEIPTLLIHGSEDDRTPVSESDELAAARPDNVRYERFEGAAHVRAWNVDAARYEAALATFLRETMLPRVGGPLRP